MEDQHPIEKHTLHPGQWCGWVHVADVQGDQVTLLADWTGQHSPAEIEAEGRRLRAAVQQEYRRYRRQRLDSEG